MHVAVLPFWAQARSQAESSGFEQLRPSCDSSNKLAICSNSLHICSYWRIQMTNRLGKKKYGISVMLVSKKVQHERLSILPLAHRL